MLLDTLVSMQCGSGEPVAWLDCGQIQMTGEEDGSCSDRISGNDDFVGTKDAAAAAFG